MRKLITTDITDNGQLPIKRGTLDHLQLAYQEALAAIANNLLGAKADAATPYILFGCVNTGTGLNYIISAGAIYYQGEVFLVDAFTFTASAGQVAVASLSTTYFTTYADPVDFTDGSQRNVHSVRKIAFASGTSGSGLFDFTSLRNTSINLNTQIVSTLPASYTVTFEQDKALFFSAATVDTTITFDFTNAVPGACIRMKWAYGSGRTLTVNQPSGSTIIKDSGNLSAVASATNILYLVYLGKNDAGNNEVSYNLKQV
ncbi:MAG: hypothetical protein WCH59_09280 [Chitinophagia bacterium]|jgi:hypothetical protein